MSEMIPETITFTDSDIDEVLADLFGLPDIEIDKQTELAHDSQKTTDVDDLHVFDSLYSPISSVDYSKSDSAELEDKRPLTPTRPLSSLAKCQLMAFFELLLDMDTWDLLYEPTLLNSLLDDVHFSQAVEFLELHSSYRRYLRTSVSFLKFISTASTMVVNPAMVYFICRTRIEIDPTTVVILE